MSLYVFALVDRPPSGRPGTGLTGPLSIHRVGDAFAVVERRADVPPAEFGTLQRHQAVVTDLAARVPAILPVRFGSLLNADALDDALDEREADLQEALAHVRDRVQFTWRGLRGSRGSTGSTGSTGSGSGSGSASGSSSSSGSGSALTGAEYLRRAALAARPTPPAAWRLVRGKLAPLVVDERYQQASATAPDTLYHLVPRDAMSRYETVAAALRHANPKLTMSGPWPPFAFAPEML
jgi:hypothetical protein